jgi:hypothetical protein
MIHKGTILMRRRQSGLSQAAFESETELKTGLVEIAAPIKEVVARRSRLLLARAYEESS